MQAPSEPTLKFPATEKNEPLEFEHSFPSPRATNRVLTVAPWQQVFLQKQGVVFARPRG